MARAPRRARGPRDVSPVPAVSLPPDHEEASRDAGVDVKAYAIDTHALIWHVSRPKRLGRRALRALRDVDGGRAQCWVPAAVAGGICLPPQGRRVPIRLAPGGGNMP